MRRMWRKAAVVILVVSWLSGCTGMGAITTASDRALGYVMNLVLDPKLQPMDVGYPGFFKDATDAINSECKNGCARVNVGWGSDEAKANFVVKCERLENGVLGCDHYKQVRGDTKVYPAGSSAFQIVSGKYDMVAFQARDSSGNQLAMGQKKSDAQLYAGQLRLPNADSAYYRPAEPTRPKQETAAAPAIQQVPPKPVQAKPAQHPEPSTPAVTAQTIPAQPKLVPAVLKEPVPPPKPKTVQKSQAKAKEPVPKKPTTAKRKPKPKPKPKSMRQAPKDGDPKRIATRKGMAV